MSNTSRRPLDVTGRLTVETDGHRIAVEASGESVVVDVPDAATLKTLLKNPQGDRDTFNALTTTLDRHDLSVEIRVAGQTVATLGSAAEPGVVERVLSLKSADVNVRQLFKAWLSR
ncbi:MAG: hypothetical protein AAF800_11365 [Planctomycetota bacterium]